jgi:hypothetical protein
MKKNTHLAFLLVLDLAIRLVHEREIARIGHDFLWAATGEPHQQRELGGGDLGGMSGFTWETYFNAYPVPNEERDLLVEVANVPLECEIAFALQRDVALELVQRLLHYKVMMIEQRMRRDIEAERLQATVLTKGRT